MRRPKITFVGGGSVNWMPRLMRDFLLTDGLEGTEYRLLDIDLQAAKNIAALGRKLSREWERPAKFVPTRNQDKAIAGADVIVIAISTGGLDAMQHDIKIPERYGIFQTVGDTVGPGGWSRALRNVPVFAGLARKIRKLAPHAAVLNYTNPMGVLTRVLAEKLDQPVVGLCHGLFSVYHRLMTVFGLKSEEEIKLNSAGLNHFFWILDLRIRGKDGYPMLRRLLKKKKYTDLFPRSHLAAELFEEFRYLTYMGDRHTCEFFSRYLAPTEQRLKLHKLVRTSVAERRKGFRRRQKEVQAMISSRKKVEQTRTRETAADIARAHVLEHEFVDVVNLPNIGQISNLPMGTVVETLGVVNALGFTPLAAGPLPDKILAVTMPHAVTQKLVTEAAPEGDREKAFDALLLDPLCSHLPVKKVREMGEKLLAANSRLLPQF